MLFKYTKQGHFHRSNNLTIFDNFKVFGQFAEDNKKVKASPNKD